MLDLKRCNGCHACINICPHNCIKMEEDSEGFLYPHIDVSMCVKCGLCEKVCSLNVIKKEHPVISYACINGDDSIRMCSSSGGVFTLIAEKVINTGGVVFGAAFTEDYRTVRHVYVDRKEDICLLRGSKYVQSEIGCAFQEAKEFLEANRLVLFTGTPCQIGGLKRFLRRDYPNLLTQDIICHGVPSPLVWKKYLTMREQKANSSVRRMFFRHKKYGWKTFSVLFSFSNNTEYVGSKNRDPYLRGFIRNLFLRPSCYNCQYKSVEHESDITLADFWGIEDVDASYFDNKGTSLVLIQSKKGKQLLNSISDLMRIQEVQLSEAIQNNAAICHSATHHPNRERFFAELRTDNTEKVMKKYCTTSALQKMKKIPGVLSYYVKRRCLSR